MNNKIDWFLKSVRIAGVNFPVAASFVQLQAEIDSAKIMSRIEMLEDPISYLHNDVPDLSKEIYKELITQDYPYIKLDEPVYIKHSQALAILESKGLISKDMIIGSAIPIGVQITDPSYIIYMCALFEDTIKMQHLFDIVDACEQGKWLDGKVIKEAIDLPLPIIQAVFDIYESNGLGACSKEISSSKYMSMT